MLFLPFILLVTPPWGHVIEDFPEYEYYCYDLLEIPENYPELIGPVVETTAVLWDMELHGYSVYEMVGTDGTLRGLGVMMTDLPDVEPTRNNLKCLFEKYSDLCHATLYGNLLDAEKEPLEQECREVLEKIVHIRSFLVCNIRDQLLPILPIRTLFFESYDSSLIGYGLLSIPDSHSDYILEPCRIHEEENGIYWEGYPEQVAKEYEEMRVCFSSHRSNNQYAGPIQRYLSLMLGFPLTD